MVQEALAQVTDQSKELPPVIPCGIAEALLILHIEGGGGGASSSGPK